MKGNTVKPIRSLLAAVAVAALSMAAPALAAAQTPGGADDVSAKRVTLNLENADLRYALKLLFNSAGINFTLDAFAQGVVTVSLTDVPFRTALESILKSTSSVNPLTYRVEGGVYFITLKKPDVTTVDSSDGPAAPAPPKQRVAKIQVNFLDARLLALALGGDILSLGDGSVLMGNGFGNGFGGGAFGGNNGGFGGFGGGYGGQSGGFGNSAFGNSGFGNGGFNNGTPFGSGFGSGSAGSGNFGGAPRGR